MTGEKALRVSDYLYRMRNAVSHGYFKVDFEVVWRTLQDDLPDLEKRIRALLAER